MRRTYQPLPLSPAALERITRAARKLHGPYSRGELAEAVAALSQVYTRERSQLTSLPSDRASLLARAAFFFPRDLPKVFGPLDELHAAGRFPSAAKLRVLDVGAGLGATGLGLARWLKLRGRGVEQLELVALEQSKSALRGCAELSSALAELPEEFVKPQLSMLTEDVRSARVAGKFDLVLFGFVLNEIARDQPEPQRTEQLASLLLDASTRLREGGVIVVLEPALRETTRELMAVRDLLASRRSAPFVLAPCVHAEPCPMLPSARDWCHQELAYALPSELAEVARAASLRYEGLSYASLVLGNQPRAASEPSLARVVSDRLESKGKLELYTCARDGYRRRTLLDRDQSAHNRDFSESKRGDLLQIESAEARLGKDTRVTRS